MKVAITNAVLSNSGDAAICQGIVTALVESGMCRASDIYIFDANAAQTRGLYPEWNIFQQLTYPDPAKNRVVRRLSRAARVAVAKLLMAFPGAIRTLPRPLARAEYFRTLFALAESPLVISSGGTYLVDHYDFRQRAVEIGLARRLGASIVLWTQSMGPFEAPRALSTIRSIKKNVDAAYFRDDRSKGYWEQASQVAMPSISTAVVPDAAFALAPSSYRKTTNSRRLILSVREWSTGLDGSKLDKAKYADSFRSLASHLLEVGISPVAMSTCQGVPGYSVDDSKTASDIFSGLRVYVDADHHSPEKLMEEVASSVAVVSTRMHLAILSLVQQVPVIAIAYEFKTVELFKNLGLDHAVCSIEDLSPEWLTSRVDDLLTNPDRYRLSDSALAQLRKGAMLPCNELSIR
ncbi:polysaccharide pyruvyl transferase family protein [Rhodococcus pyridinivorans]